jgi:hypothetical protein
MEQPLNRTRKKRSFNEAHSDTPKADGIDHDEHTGTDKKKKESTVAKTSLKGKSSTANTARKERNKISARNSRSRQQKHREDTDAMLLQLQNEVSDLRSSVATTHSILQSAIKTKGGVVIGPQIRQAYLDAGVLEKFELSRVHGLNIEYVNAVSFFNGSTVSTGHNAVSERDRI